MLSIILSRCVCVCPPSHISLAGEGNALCPVLSSLLWTAGTSRRGGEEKEVEPVWGWKCCWWTCWVTGRSSCQVFIWWLHNFTVLNSGTRMFCRIFPNHISVFLSVATIDKYMSQFVEFWCVIIFVIECAKVVWDVCNVWWWHVRLGRLVWFLIVVWFSRVEDSPETWITHNVFLWRATCSLLAPVHVWLDLMWDLSVHSLDLVFDVSHCGLLCSVLYVALIY